MAVHSFSTKAKRPQDELMVAEIKHYCEQRHIIFSGLILDLLKQYMEEVINAEVR